MDSHPWAFIRHRILHGIKQSHHGLHVHGRKACTNQLLQLCTPVGLGPYMAKAVRHDGFDYGYCTTYLRYGEQPSL